MEKQQMWNYYSFFSVFFNLFFLFLLGITLAKRPFSNHQPFTFSFHFLTTIQIHNTKEIEKMERMRLKQVENPLCRIFSHDSSFLKITFLLSSPPKKKQQKINIFLEIFHVSFSNAFPAGFSSEHFMLKKKWG